MSEYMIVPVLLTFSNGEKLEAEFTMPKKAYWQGQLENEIMRRYNHNTPPESCKVVKVKVFRNIKEGGIMIDIVRGRVIRV